MKKQFKIHNRRLKSLVFDNLKMAGFVIIVFSIYSKWKDGTEFIFEQFYIWFFLGFIAITNLPAIILYINYYLENKDIRFTLDFDNEKIVIEKDGTLKEYSKNDIQDSTYHMGIYYKNAIDRAGRLPMLISDFGYWDLQFKNGDRYYLSNVLHDFLHDAPLVPKTKYRFRFFPYIKKNDKKQAIDLNEKKKIEKSLTEKFIEKFKDKNEKQLMEILNNRISYQKEAVNAAEILIKNKLS